MENWTGRIRFGSIMEPRGGSFRETKPAPMTEFQKKLSECAQAYSNYIQGIKAGYASDAHRELCEVINTLWDQYRSTSDYLNNPKLARLSEAEHFEETLADAFKIHDDNERSQLQRILRVAQTLRILPR